MDKQTNNKNIAIILAGGIGSRLGIDTPKQFIKVNGTMIIERSIKAVILCKNIDGFIIVSDKQWRDFIKEAISKINYGIDKFIGFADAGVSRQQSILSAMRFLSIADISNIKNIIIHDSARPNITEGLLSDYIKEVKGYDGVMPSLPMKDTIYVAKDGEIKSLLDRDSIVAGQTPEVFVYSKYWDAITSLTDDELKECRGSSEIAIKAGMKIKVVGGDERNYKITTKEDLERYSEESYK